MAVRRLVLGLLILCAACSSRPPGERRDGAGGQGGGGGGSGGTGAVDCNAEPKGTPAPVGLDVRPENATCHAPPRPSSAANVQLARVFPALTFDQPLLLLQPPDDPGRWFVLEKPGRILTFATSPEPTEAQVFADLTDRVESKAKEAGLLGMAFHPDWPQVPEVFVSYISLRGGTYHGIVSRFRATPQGLDAGSEELVLDVPKTSDHHNGGHLAFGPDRLLYAAFGDGGHGVNVPKDDLLLGKMVRIDVLSAKPYAIPPDNPWVGGPLRPEVWATGFRNPWRWSIDRETGAIWLGDVGYTKREEIDRVEKGRNYGWPTREGTGCLRDPPCESAGFTEPVLDYGRDEGISVTGGYVYRGAKLPALHGAYVFGDFGNGNVWALFPDEARHQLLVESGLNIASFGEGIDGEIYAVDHVGGGLYALTPVDGQAAFPGKLSETGCADPTDPGEPAPGMLPYDVNVALWSDGAGKHRWLAIPDGTTIAVGADGDWDLPPGSVLRKDFLLDCRHVETRLFVRHDDGGWAGYTYAWNDEQTDAVLLSDRKSIAVDGGTWTFPSRAECMQCHTAAAGRSLGLETAQLDREIVWPGGRRSNVIDTLVHLGVLESMPDRGAGPLPDPVGSAHVEQRAKSYLHANCSSCHRPEGTGQGTADFRYATPLAAMGICNAEPQQGDGGLAGARLIVPGDAAHSVIPHRMRALDQRRMPPLGTAVADDDGAAVVEEWIGWLQGCE